MKTEVYAVALSICSSPSINQIWNLISLYKSEKIYEELVKTRELTTQGFILAKYSNNPLSAASQICEECDSKNIKILSYWDEDYPKILKEISKPPIVLYCKGNFVSHKSIAIVGTRKAGKKSSEITRRLSGELSQAGYTIVSGMAIGIDREAHLGALNNNGSTIGVLANGIDIAYPVYNKDLYSAILNSEKSSVISEYPPGIFAGKWTFVRRNRIISGLSLGTIIVKAAKKSGALITAHHALEQNREVFACPGLTFDSAYSGCNDLIRNGAILVSGTEDILKELNDYEQKKSSRKEVIVLADKQADLLDVLKNNSKPEKNYDPDSVESKILKLLSSGDTDIDSMVRLLHYSPNIINEAIIMLELANEITRDGNMISKF